MRIAVGTPDTTRRARRLAAHESPCAADLTSAPSQRNRILTRDNNIYLKCKHDDRPLVVAHWISVHDGKAVGLAEAELFDDENLIAMCAECNAGQGSETLPLRFMATVLRVRIARRRKAS